MKKQHQTARLIFKTADGLLVMDREIDLTIWHETEYDFLIERHLREKGVKEIDRKHDGANGDIYVMVDWL